MWSDPADWDSNADMGAHHADVACPDAPPTARVAKLSTHQLCTHSTAGEGAGPTLKGTRVGRDQVRVSLSYRRRRGTMRKDGRWSSETTQAVPAG
jgi:hypothetical protein